jgi:D-alanyl-D-alanine carboxypeptidase
VKTRNHLPNRGVARIYSARVLALLLAFSLTLIAAPPAGAINICTIDPKSVACITSKGSSLQVVVNKTRPLNPKTYYPSDLVRVPQFNPLGRILRKNVSAAVVLMGKQMKADGKGTLVVQSGFRSYSSQKTIHAAKVRAIGKTKGEKLAARPGYSEHQTGLAVDFAAAGVSTLHVSFAKTKAGIWLAANAYKYGFVLRYPKDKTSVTGYQFEPWHFRFVGIEVATAMHDQNILTLEEFYGLPAAPNYLN